MHCRRGRNIFNHSAQRGGDITLRGERPCASAFTLQRFQPAGHLTENIASFWIKSVSAAFASTRLNPDAACVCASAIRCAFSAARVVGVENGTAATDVVAGDGISILSVTSSAADCASRLTCVMAGSGSTSASRPCSAQNHHDRYPLSGISPHLRYCPRLPAAVTDTKQHYRDSDSSRFLFAAPDHKSIDVQE